MTGNEALRRLTKDFVEADTWAASQQLVEAHPELLSDAAQQLLDQQANGEANAGDVHAAQVLRRHRQLLQRAAEIGVDAAFNERAEAHGAGMVAGMEVAQTMLAFIQADPDEALSLINEHPELLSDELDGLWEGVILLAEHVLGREFAETVQHKRQLLRSIRERNGQWTAESTVPADVAIAEGMAHDDLLAAIHERLNRFRLHGDPAVVLVPAALAEAAALCHPAARLVADAEARELLGWFHWCRYLNLPRGQDEDDLFAACGFLWPVYRHSPADVPDQIRTALDGLANSEGDPARELFAGAVMSQARLTKNPLAQDRCIGYLRQLLHDSVEADRRVESVPGRLIVRRIPDLNPRTRQGQETLFDTWRFHAFFTTTAPEELDTVAADQTHRRHAIIENVHADLKASALAHLPSGVFNANAAWLVCAVMAFNLTRAAATVTHTPALAKAATATIRRKLIHVPARIATSARRLRLHLPTNWPWDKDWSQLYQAVLPARAPAT